MPSLPVPQEISNHMMEFVKTDTNSLKNCGLVCKSWLYPSRSHLFRTIVLDRDNADAFSSLVLSVHSTIPTFVRCLRLSLDSHWFQLLMPFLQVFGETTVVILENIDWPRINLFARTNFLDRFGPSLTDLELRNLEFATFADVVDVLCEFPLLQALSLTNVSWIPSSPSASPIILKDLSTRRLTKLVLRDCAELRPVLVWLLSHNSIPVVHSIELSPISDNDILLSSRYLRYIGPRLLHLTVTLHLAGPVHACFVDPHPIVADLAPFADFKTISDFKASNSRHDVAETELINEQGGFICGNLASLISLRTLHIEDFIVHTNLEHTNALWAPRILLSVRSPYLERVSFGMQLSRAGEVDAHCINWPFLDRILTQGRKENLKKVEIVHGGLIKRDVIQQLISSRWPACNSAGKLVFIPKGERGRV